MVADIKDNAGNLLGHVDDKEIKDAHFEIIGYDRDKDIPVTNEVFKWDPKTNTYKTINESIVFKKISERFGIKENFLKLELSRREKVLGSAVERNIENYSDYANIIIFHLNSLNLRVD